MLKWQIFRLLIGQIWFHVKSVWLKTVISTLCSWNTVHSSYKSQWVNFTKFYQSALFFSPNFLDQSCFFTFCFWSVHSRIFYFVVREACVNMFNKFSHANYTTLEIFDFKPFARLKCHHRQFCQNIFANRILLLMSDFSIHWFVKK